MKLVKLCIKSINNIKGKYVLKAGNHALTSKFAL